MKRIIAAIFVVFSCGLCYAQTLSSYFYQNSFYDQGVGYDYFLTNGKEQEEERYVYNDDATSIIRIYRILDKSTFMPTWKTIRKTIYDLTISSTAIFSEAQVNSSIISKSARNSDKITLLALPYDDSRINTWSETLNGEEYSCKVEWSYMQCVDGDGSERSIRVIKMTKIKKEDNCTYISFWGPNIGKITESVVSENETGRTERLLSRKSNVPTNIHEIGVEEYNKRIEWDEFVSQRTSKVLNLNSNYPNTYNRALKHYSKYISEIEHDYVNFNTGYDHQNYDRIDTLKHCFTYSADIQYQGEHIIESSHNPYNVGREDYWFISSLRESQKNNEPIAFTELDPNSGKTYLYKMSANFTVNKELTVTQMHFIMKKGNPFLKEGNQEIYMKYKDLLDEQVIRGSQRGEIKKIDIRIADFEVNGFHSLYIVDRFEPSFSSSGDSVYLSLRMIDYW